MKKTIIIPIFTTLAMACWGANWVAAKILSGLADPSFLVAIRFLLTSVFIAPIIAYKKESFKLNKTDTVLVIIAAALMAVYHFFFFKGLQYGFAGASGVLVTSLNPIFTFLITSILFKQKLPLKSVLWLLIGLLGSLSMIQLWTFSWSFFLSQGTPYFIADAVLWALITIISQGVGISPLKFSFYTFGISGIVFSLFIGPGTIISTLLNAPILLWLSLFYVVLFGSIFASTMYFYTSATLGSRKAASFTFMVPLFAVLFSWLLLDEVPKAYTLIGGIVTIIAVWRINTHQREILQRDLFPDKTSEHKD